MNIGFNRPNGLEILKMGVLNDDGRRLDGYTISSASKPNSSGGLKISVFHLKITIFSF